MAKDKQSAFRAGDFAVPDVPPEIDGGRYHKEDGKVYYIYEIQLPYPPMSSCGPICYRAQLTKILDADAESFIPLGDSVAVDKNKIFIQGMTHNEKPDNSAAYQPAGRIWRQKDGNVAEFVHSQIRADYDLFSADPQTLASCDISDPYNKYFKDKNHVYYKYDLLKDADAATFREVRTEKSGWNYVFTDKNHSYKDGKAAGESLLPVPPEKRKRRTPYHYEIDPKQIKNNTVYKDDLDLKLDPATAVRIGRDYYKDKNKVVYVTYEDGRRVALPVEGADPAAFTGGSETAIEYSDADEERYSNDGDYMKDDKHVFFRGIKLENSDSKTFEILSGGYAKDKNNVYYQRDGKINIAEGADAKTFRPADGDGYTWMDKRDTYQYGKKAYYIKRQTEN